MLLSLDMWRAFIEKHVYELFCMIFKESIQTEWKKSIWMFKVIASFCWKNTNSPRLYSYHNFDCVKSLLHLFIPIQWWYKHPCGKIKWFFTWNPSVFCSDFEIINVNTSEFSHVCTCGTKTAYSHQERLKCSF